MFLRCSIRHKLLLGVALLFLIVVTLSVTGLRGISSYRRLVRTVSQRAAELPLADRLTRSVDDLVLTFNRVRQWRDDPDRTQYNPVALSEEFNVNWLRVTAALGQYRLQLEGAEPDDSGIGDNRDEWEAVRTIERSLERIDHLQNENDWRLEQVQLNNLGDELETLHDLTSGLPRHLQNRMLQLKGNVRGQYHRLIGLAWGTSILSTAMLVVLVILFRSWVFRPLAVLIDGSRRVAGGDFNHRIRLNARDEMAELAEAMNMMTTRFQQIRDELDRRVKQRTKEVLRSEQLASVGFLAAGVAHEINNPLASIAWCAEALESRLHSILYQEQTPPTDEQNEEVQVLRRYLRRIQDEAFRCKGITEKLLDFSRIGDTERQNADLRELTQDVIDMVRHLGGYRNKRIEFHSRDPVLARVNPREIKQVVLNLITNALDSLEPDGVVEVDVRKERVGAVLCVRDNGCGMTEEVLEHLFEPFFTRRRDGQGTGLGLSIAYRIVVDHGGAIEVHSDGPRKGSTFQVTLPLAQHEETNEKQLQAA